jgi:hypothetical protein
MASEFISPSVLLLKSWPVEKSAGNRKQAALLEAICSKEISIHVHETTHHIPEDLMLHSHHCENLKSSEEWCLLGCYAVWLL